MMFNSFIYFIFLAVLLPLFYFAPKNGSRKIILLLASYIFYSYWDWRFCSLLILLTLLNFYVSIYLNSDSRFPRKLLFNLAIVFNLSVLFFFKYFNFFLENLQFILNGFGAQLDALHINIIVPLGVSFYIFQSLSYIIDVYYKRISHSRSIVDFSLFIAFFPKLIAGPIEKTSALLPQFSKKLIPSRQQIIEGVNLIISGLFRKVMIGDTSGKYVEHIFGNIEYYKAIELLSALVLFAVQIYADFSGYSMIARGTAKLFGIELMKNFKQPYFSVNITDFWQRWHISLSNWLKDYLYIPLSYKISKALPKEKYLKIKTEYYIYIVSSMITFIICGFWHGPSWNYVIWGFLHGVYLSIHRVLFKKKKRKKTTGLKKLISVCSSIFTNFIFVLIAWLFFIITTKDSFYSYMGKILHWEHSEYTFIFIKITAVYLAVVFVLDLIEVKTGEQYLFIGKKYQWFWNGILFGLFIFTLLFLFQSKTSPFIYFAF